jgi:hypothetical protein
MKLLQIILLIVLLYYLLTKYVFPFLLARLIRKVQQNFQQFENPNNQPPQRREGEIKVDYVPPTAKKTEFNPTDAEEIDFVEIKDK